MIGKLKGTVDEIGEDFCVIDVHGVCYVAFCSARTLASLPAPGEAVILFIETYVREDVIRLYGFLTALEREWFRLLQSNVQGVGAKVALAVLSTLTTADLANAIALRDVAMVSRAPGVGKKVAERIVTELKDKAPAYAGSASGTIGAEAGARRGCRSRPGGRRRLGAHQSRLFARHRRQCCRGGDESRRRRRGFGEAHPAGIEGAGAVVLWPQCRR
jgi:holliday junction DNA helicase RuvA